MLTNVLNQSMVHGGSCNLPRRSFPILHTVLLHEENFTALPETISVIPLTLFSCHQLNNIEPQSHCNDYLSNFRIARFRRTNSFTELGDAYIDHII